MKKLQLKIRDLANPSILTHQDIKNIMGGVDNGSGLITYTCTFYYLSGSTSQQTCSGSTINECQNAADQICLNNEDCSNVVCK